VERKEHNSKQTNKPTLHRRRFRQQCNENVQRATNASTVKMKRLLSPLYLAFIAVLAVFANSDFRDQEIEESPHRILKKDTHAIFLVVSYFILHATLSIELLR